MMRNAGARILLVALAAVTTARPARASGALAAVADAVAKGLGGLPAQAMVVAAPLASDQPVPRGDELATRVAAAVAGRVGGAARVHPRPTSLGGARAAARKSAALVFVQPSIAKGEVRATVDVYSVPSNGWERVRAPLAPPQAHAFASAPIDAEVHSFLPPIVLESAKVRRVTHDEGDVLAVACGDVDGDGGMELGLVTRTRVALGRVRGRAFVPEKTALWSSIAARVPVPLREPLAGAVFGSSRGPSRLLYVGTSDRVAVGLDRDLKVRARLGGIPVAWTDGAAEGVCATPSADDAAFDAVLLSCTVATDKASSRPDLPSARFDAFAAADVGGATGASASVVATRDPSGVLRVSVAGREARTLDDVGAQIAVGDLDLDGVPEVISTADTGEDFVAVRSVAEADFKVRLRLPAPAGVRALAICPPEEHGVPVLVAVVGNEVWLVR